MNQEQAIHVKDISSRKRCGDYRTWFGDHNENGWLPHHMPSGLSLLIEDKQNSRSHNAQKIDGKDGEAKFVPAFHIAELSQRYIGRNPTLNQ